MNEAAAPSSAGLVRTFWLGPKKAHVPQTLLVPGEAEPLVALGGGGHSSYDLAKEPQLRVVIEFEKI